MRRLSCLILLGSFLISCEKNEFELTHLNGYWEIDKVELQNESKRDYTVNTTIDYFEIKSDSTGIRKKVKPNLDGTFETSADYETFKIVKDGQKLQINFKTPLMDYSEEILKLNDEQLIFLNENAIRYIYKRYKPLEL